MDKGNVIVIGNSGVGKSTLINSVLGESRARTSWGKAGTSKLDIYENDQVPFRVIDTIGFEPSMLGRNKAIDAVKKWCKESASKDDKQKQVNLIWFCVDGTAKRLFRETIEDMIKATRVWKSVPIVIVITKSYSQVEIMQNIRMAEDAFERQPYSDRLRKVIPVVADAYPIDETTIVPPSGIESLIEVTNQCMPEGIAAAKRDLDDFILDRKRHLAQACIVAFIAPAAAIGALPIAMADAAILGPLEGAEVKTIARVYGIQENDRSKALFDTIVGVGTVSIAAKGIISTLKAVPGINLAADVLNAVIAGSIVAALGEGCAYAFEKIYRGEKGIADLDWVEEFMEEQLSNEMVTKVLKSLSELGSGLNVKSAAKLVTDVFEETEGEKAGEVVRMNA